MSERNVFNGPEASWRPEVTPPERAAVPCNGGRFCGILFILEVSEIYMFVQAEYPAPTWFINGNYLTKNRDLPRHGSSQATGNRYIPLTDSIYRSVFDLSFLVNSFLTINCSSQHNLSSSAVKFESHTNTKARSEFFF